MGREEFNTEFAKKFGAKYSFSFWKARVGLYAILKSLGVSSGDEIIIPGYTCVVNVNPIKYLGAKPIYIDIEPNTFNLNTDQLEEKINNKNKSHNCPTYVWLYLRYGTNSANCR